MSIDYNKLNKEIKLTGFFSEYLPPIFNLNKKVFRITPPDNCDLIDPFYYTMGRFDNQNSRRIIALPEICAYLVVCNYIKENNIIKDFVEFTERNEDSFSPILSDKGALIRHEQLYYLPDIYTENEVDEEVISNYVENVAKKICKSVGAKRILKLDISKCFDSFYTHFIPAIFLGKEEAEKQYRKERVDRDDPTIKEEYKKYSKLDVMVRKEKKNMTNGLLVGPLLSRIIIEGILTRIDIELRRKEVLFSRYVDDYEVYIYGNNTESVKCVVEGVLQRYGFTLNHQKTDIIDFPYYIVENLNKILEMYYKKEPTNIETIELFDKFLLLEKNGVKGAIRFLLKSLENKQFNGNNSELYKSYLITIINNNERSLVKACTLLIDNKRFLRIDNKDKMVIERVLKEHIEKQNDLEVIWLIYLLIRTKKLRKNAGVIKSIVLSNNELAQLLLLRTGYLNLPHINIIKEKARSWILLYELYCADYLDDREFTNRLNLDKNYSIYSSFKQNNIHFCN